MHASAQAYPRGRAAIRGQSSNSLASVSRVSTSVVSGGGTSGGGGGGGGAPPAGEDAAAYIEKLERKLKIAVAECHSYRQRMESALKLADNLETEMQILKKKYQELSNSLGSRGRSSDGRSSPSDNDRPTKWRVSEKAAYHWSLVRAAVQVSSLLTQGVLANRLNEDTFVAVLARHSRSKQRLLFREIFRVIRRYRSLLTISNSIATEVQVDKAIQKIVEATYEILVCDRVTLFIVDPVRSELECRVSKDSTGWRIPIGRGLAGECAATGETFNIKECYEDPRFNQKIDRDTGYRTRTMLCMPIRDNYSNVVAVVQAINKLDGVFTLTDELLLTSVAIQSGNILRRAQLYEDEVRSKRRNAALLQVVKSVSQSSGDNGTDLETLIRQVMTTSQQTLNCHRVSLFQVDSINQELVCKVSEDAKGFRIKMTAGIVGHVATTGETLNVVDAYLDPRFNQDFDRKTNYRTRTILCIPVRARNSQVVAVIQAINKYCGACGEMACARHGVEFDSEDVALMDAFSVEISSALQRQQLEMAFSKIAEDRTLDTGVKNYISQFTKDHSSEHQDSGDAGSSDAHNDADVYASSALDLGSGGVVGGGGGSDLQSGKHFLSLEVNRELIRSNPLLQHTPAVQADAPLSSANQMALEEHSWPVVSPSLGFGIDEFASFEFDYFERCTPQNFPTLIILAFNEFRLFQQLNINVQKMHNFIDAVCRNYVDNPYHNWTHAFSVMHVVFVMSRSEACTDLLSPIDIFSALVAALCHDLRHPGTNNFLQINACSDLALRYNDVSVLENYHASVCFSILQDAECNILSGLTKAQFRECRAAIISSILHTDMTRHNDLVKTIKLRAASTKAGTKVFDKTNKDDRQCVRDLLVHSGDLANPILPFNIYKRWAELIFEEMYRQSQTEKALGLPSALRIEKQDQATLADLQVSFINYIVMPLWVEVGNVFPFLKSVLVRLNENKARYAMIAEAAKAANA